MLKEGNRPVSELWSIVLAAGESARLGRPKQLVRYKTRPLLSLALARANRVCSDRVVIVLGAEALRLRALLRRDRLSCVAVHNRRWRDGLASSLRAGLAALPGRAAAALILLSDQPKIPDRALTQMVRVWRRRPTRAVAACYQGRAGVPAIIPRKFWPELECLDGDVGARAVLRKLSDIALTDVPEAAFDVDTPADLSRL